MLTLPIEKKWFDMIEKREKKEEYREDTPYWRARFNKFLIGAEYFKYRRARLRNGYQKDSPTLEIEYKIDFGQGREEWGAKPGEKYFILRILEVERII
jgi:hypothetical protein